MYDKLQYEINAASSIIIIQAENPDGDSLGSALGLEEILGDAGKDVILYCPVDIPKYLRYIKGWDRVTDEWPKKFDLALIVDTASATLLERAIISIQKSQLERVPVFILDHHQTEGDIPFPSTAITDPTCVATAELIVDIANALQWSINTQAAENLAIAVLSDSLGLTTPNTSAKSVLTLAQLVKAGAELSRIEGRRRELMKKSAEILKYKGKLIDRIEYCVDGKLALVHIPWSEIEQYSDRYNPSVLVLDEMRLVEGVHIAVAIKSYPDGKITGKIRCNPNTPIAETVAGYFGGGGHLYAAGFRTYDSFDSVKTELIKIVTQVVPGN